VYVWGMEEINGKDFQDVGRKVEYLPE